MDIRRGPILLSLICCLSYWAESKLTYQEEKQILDELISKYTGRKASREWLDRRSEADNEASQYLQSYRKRTQPAGNL